MATLQVRKFLQFQLTVNAVALGVAFSAAVTSGATPLSVLQLLWVRARNLGGL